MEKLQIQELLRNEELCVTKCQAFANQVQDPGLKDICTRMVNISHRRIDELNSVLRETGLSQQHQ